MDVSLSDFGEKSRLGALLEHFSRIEDPRGLKIAWDKPTTELLDDARFAVRDRAIEACSEPSALRSPSARS